METQAITLMEAYIIENLRKNGISNDELIAINEQAIEQWKTVNDSYDYAMLEALSNENRDSFSSVIKDGYRVKFLTLNGLVNLLQLKLTKTRDTDFEVHDDGISKLVVTPDELKEIKQMLSVNWKIEQVEHSISIRSSVG